MILMLMRLTGLSRVAIIASLVAAAITLLGVAKCTYDRSVIAAHERDIAAEIAKKSQAGAEAAASASASTRSEVEKSNDDARKAATGSDDPLRRGLDSLHKGPPSARPSAR